MKFRPSVTPLIIFLLAVSASFLRLEAAELNVVFLGDSLTAQWDLKDSFPGSNYVNLGIPGDTTSLMVPRFQKLLATSQPKLTVILGGTNDIYQGKSLEDTKRNVKKMAALSRLVILCTVPPMRGKSSKFNLSIVAYNKWLRAFAAKKHIPLADYFGVLADTHGELKQEFTDDDLGIHLNPAGYRAITQVADKFLPK